jgi:hypothetical protein
MSIPDSFAPAKATVIELIDLEQIANPVLLEGATYWKSLCGAKSYPAREQVNPRDIKGALNNLILLKVIDGGADFEHRILGDAVVRAYRVEGHGRKLSDIEAVSPELGAKLRRVYSAVVQARRPINVRIRIGQDSPEVNYSAGEVAFFPLGPSDDIVDHLMGFAAFTWRSV